MLNRSLPLLSADVKVIQPYIQGGKKQVLELPITKSDVGTQTDTHFMESNIVGFYEWNEWELRRKALKLVSNIIHGTCIHLDHAELTIIIP